MQSLDLATLRPYIFLVCIITSIISAKFHPAFKNTCKKRLKINTILFALSILTLRVAFPMGLYQLAVQVQSTDRSVLGLSNIPYSAILTIILFDLAIYWQHRLSHIIKPIWALHAVHHADTEMDFTTALRFHPIEIALSGLYKMMLITFFGPTAISFLIYEIILNSMAVFNHSNIKLPNKLERVLRLFIVTPQMHFPHHHPSKELTNSNYGNFLSIWDRIFKSYTPEYTDTFGLDYVSDENAKSLQRQLFLNLK